MRTRSLFSRLLFLSLVLLLTRTFGCSSGGGGVGTSDTGTWTGVVQIGTPMTDEALGIDTDGSGNVYVAGGSAGDIDNCGCLNPQDGFIAKYGRSGEPEWLFEVDAEGISTLRGIAVTADGHVVAAGWTDKDYAGTGIAGGDDILLFRLDATGYLDWVFQTGSSDGDYPITLDSDLAGNVYVAGYTEGSLPGKTNAGGRDVFVMKVDPRGVLKWVTQFGSEEGDFAEGTTVEASSNVYVVGRTFGSLGGTPNAGDTDIFVAVLDPAGALQWILQLGTSEAEGAYSVAVDNAGNAYVAGNTTGDLGGERNAGGTDVFLVKLAHDGTLEWVRLLGTERDESGCAVVLDGEGKVYVTGATSGSMAAANAGGNDVILAKFDENGDLLWTRQFGTPEDDECYGVAVDSDGNLFLSGSTGGDLDDNTNAGDKDVFVAKFDREGNRY